MSNAVDKRAYLVGLGLASEGRGRFSRAALDALAAAEAAGTVFVDKKAAVTTVVVTNEDGEKVEERREFNQYAPHAPAIRSGMLTFVGPDKKKHEVAASNACHSCSMSFGWCYEETPTFFDWKSGEVWTLRD